MDLSEVRTSQRRHPWETARAVALERILRAAQLQPQTVLDYGCGDGFTGERLHSVFSGSRLQGFDIYLTDQQCEERSRGTIRYVNTWEQVERSPFELGLLCDVIEHVPDDRALLTQIAERVEETGHLLITVPAFQSLFTSHDRALRHFRRYSLSHLEQVARSAGLSVVRSGYLFASLLPLRGLSKLVETLKPKRDDEFGIGAWNGSAALTSIMQTVLGLDNAILFELGARGIKLPGLSAWTLCSKQPS